MRYVCVLVHVINLFQSNVCGRRCAALAYLGVFTNRMNMNIRYDHMHTIL
jgi:hypothetical protein